MAFEFRNDFYPDVDDTAFVLMALQRVDYPDKGRMEAAVRRGLTWLLAMQNRDAAGVRSTTITTANFCARFVRGSQRDDRSFHCGRNCARRGVSRPVRMARDASRDRAGRKILLKDQTGEGPWFGRWGVNYVYGTSGVLRALETVALTAQGYCQRAVGWLRQCKIQTADLANPSLHTTTRRLRARAPALRPRPRGG